MQHPAGAHLVSTPAFAAGCGAAAGLARSFFLEAPGWYKDRNDATTCGDTHNQQKQQVVAHSNNHRHRSKRDPRSTNTKQRC